MVAVALNNRSTTLLLLVMMRRTAAALMARAGVAAASTVGPAYWPGLRLWLEQAKESGGELSNCLIKVDTYLVLLDDSSFSSVCLFLLPQVQPTHTGFGFGFGLKKNLNHVLFAYLKKQQRILDLELEFPSCSSSSCTACLLLRPQEFVGR